MLIERIAEGALTPADDRAIADPTCLHLSGNRSRAIHGKAAESLMVLPLQSGARDAGADPDLPGTRSRPAR